MAAQMEDEDEDDYLTMTFDDVETAPKNETFAQKRRRLAREAEDRSRPKSKAQLAAEADRKREVGLSTSTLDNSSKGFKMMAALGYKQGSALGKNPTSTVTNGDHRIREPIAVEMKEDRSGIGVISEKKRKFREEIEKQDLSEKKQKMDALEYREWQQKEREERRQEGQFWGAMKVAHRLEEEDLAKDSEVDSPQSLRKPLGEVNVLWRTLVRQRLLDERKKNQLQEFNTAFHRKPIFDDVDEDADDKLALGKNVEIEDDDTELDRDDPELDDFLELPPSERLEKVIDHLRSHWHYCFWCKHRYQDENMEGCPGVSEDEHG